MSTKLALLICSILVCVVAQDNKRFFIFAPNVFRLNVEETVSVQVWKATQVELYLQDERRSKVISKVAKNLQANKPEIIKLKITEEDLPRSWKDGKLHYHLIGKANGVQKETQVLLDLRPGTVFIQTDKPIYKPDEKVLYRIIPVGLDFLPLKEKVTIEIKNPQGIRVRKENDIEAWKEGFATKEYMLGNLAVQGTWTMTAFFGAKGMVNSSTTFAVREYVLPTFQVRIIPPMYIAETTDTFPIKVSAKYSHGKEVKGTVRLRLSLQGAGKEIEVDDQDFEITGEDVFRFRKDQLIEPKEIVSFPIGQKLRISAVVTERATGTKERASDHFVTIVKSPYTISFEKTVRYFKPDLTFRVTATVRYPDKRPAKRVKLSIEASSNGRSLLTAGVSNDAKTNELGDALFTLNVPKIADDSTRIKIKVKTIEAGVTNAVAELEVEPYRSPNKYYILARGPMRPPLLGDRVNIQVLIPENVGVTQLNHLVVARGKVVEQGVIKRDVGTESSVRFRVTEEMAPKCRIIVYFERNGEVVADSILMDVQDALKNQVKLSTDVGMDYSSKHSVAPAMTFLLTVKARKESWLGLLAVDQSVYYLRNKSRVTHKKVFDDIGSFDLGCGLGAGRDNRDVFDKAGVAVVTNAQLSTSKRNDMTCPGNSKSRKRRNVNQLALVEKCCKGKCCDNFFDSRVRISPRTKCDELKNRVAPTCWEDFYRCCRRKFEVRGRNIDLGDIDGEFVVSADELLEVDDLTVRKEFPESWIWHNIYTGDKDTIHKSFTVPDSITTWELSAISMNNKTGFGISKTLDLESTKDFFVSIKMPYSVQRREQVTIYAIIYNFNNGKQRANLYFTGHKSFCSIAAPGKKSRRISVVIDGNDAVAIPFTIIPLEIGKSPIEFVAYKDGDGDKIFKTLSVVPEGVQQKESVSFLLDPQVHKEIEGPLNLEPKKLLWKDNSKNNWKRILRNKTKKIDKVIEENRKDRQINSYEMTLPESYVKDSESAMLYVTGNLMTAGVEDMIDKGLEKLIQLPTGCGEQTMIRMAPLVYVLRYMYSTKDGVTSAVEKKAYDYLRKGYNQELKWRRTDNSYSVWGQRTPACTWLTAFVNKVFCQATQYIKDDIDNAVICDSLEFLQSIQQADGSFKEAYAVRHREMIGGNNGAISLTSFVLISLLECKSQCANANSKVVLQASQFLAKNIPGIKDGYLMSIVSYALVLADSPSKQQAYTKLKGMLVEEIKNGREVNYIKDGGPALKVESTAYTLLTMLRSNEIDSAGPLVIWLTEQRNSRGSFYSTQDTVIALQALSEYSSRTAGGELDLQITVTATRNKDVRKIIKVLPENALVRQQFDISQALPGRINIDTRGKGTAQLQVEITYNKPSTDNERCGYFVEVKTDEGIDNTVNDAPAGATKVKPRPKEAKKNCKKIKNKKKRRKCKKRNKKLRNKQKDQVVNKINVEVCARHKSANGSSMTIFDVGILSGFEPNKKELKQLKTTNRDPRVDRYEISDRSILFYLRKVSNLKQSCIRFSLQKTVTIGALQAVPVKVYDYYEPGDACTTFYGPKKGSQLQKPICEGDECQCSQGDCAVELTTNPKRLKKMACIDHDLTFMGVVGQVKDMNAWKRITFKITSVYKKGQKNLNAGDKISVYISSSCEYPKVTVSQKFIVMLKDGNKYLLDKTSAILEWPKEGAKRNKVQLALDEVKKGKVCDEF